jgi:hypothetical protein
MARHCVHDLLYADTTEPVFWQIAFFEHLDGLGRVLVFHGMIVERELVVEPLCVLSLIVVVLRVKGIFARIFVG